MAGNGSASSASREGPRGFETPDARAWSRDRLTPPGRATAAHREPPFGGDGGCRDGFSVRLGQSLAEDRPRPGLRMSGAQGTGTDRRAGGGARAPAGVPPP